MYKDEGLSITTEPHYKCTNYLDINLNLDTNEYSPFKKPNDEIVYVHKESDHPATILRQIPTMIATHLSDLSSNSDIFNKGKKPYTDALKQSGYSGNLII